MRFIIQLSVRRLVRSWAFTAFAVFTLAAGVGVTVAALSSMLAVASGPVVSEGGDLIFVAPAGVSRPNRTATISHTDLAELVRQQHSLSDIAGWTRLQGSLASASSARLVDVDGVTGTYFRTLGLKPLRGRLLGPQDDSGGGADVVVLSESVWQTEFNADDSIVGSPIRIAGQTFTIVGVGPPAFHGLASSWNLTNVVWIPELRARRLRSEVATNKSLEHPLSVVARLKAGSTVTSAASELALIAARLDVLDPSRGDPFVKTRGRAWSAIPFQKVFSPITPDTAFAFLALPLVVLLISGTNLANLSLSRGVSRLGELTTRYALGASRMVLIREQLAESVLVCVGGGLLGLWLARILISETATLITSYFAPLLPGITLDIRLHPTVFVAAVASVVFAVVVGGLIPAHVLTKPSISVTLMAHSASTLPRWRGRGNVIAVQVGITVWLFLLTQVAVAKIKVPRGIVAGTASTERLAIAYVPLTDQHFSRDRSAAALSAILAEVRTIPGIRAVAAGTYLPLVVPWPPSPVTSIDAASSALSKPDSGTTARLFGITEGSLTALGFKTVVGRGLQAVDSRRGADTLVVTEDLARALFGSTAVIDRRVYWRHRRILSEQDVVRHGSIVGVVRGPTMEKPNTMIAFTATEQTYLPAVTLAIVGATDDASVLVRPLERGIARAAPDLAVAAVGQADRLGGSPAVIARALVVASSILASVSLLLAMTGLYGVLSHTVNLRVREMALRIALGASPLSVIKLISLDGLRPVLEGIVIGVLAAMAGRQIIQTALAEPWPAIGVADCIIVAFALLVVSLAVCVTIGRRASMTNPSDLLRSL